MTISKHALVALSAFSIMACNDDSSEFQGQVAETAVVADSTAAEAENTEGLCLNAGPQTPRDISLKSGSNPTLFTIAPASDQMNLCNIHTHTNAEHKGPGFSVYAGDGDHGGYQCNDTASLSAAELTDPANGKGAFKGVKPGDTIEVHWAHSSCDVSPGEGLASCLSDTCTDPLIRVEAQVFLIVNDPEALDFNDFTYGGNVIDGRHQPKALPTGTGAPVIFRGSTTGPSYTQSACSAVQVTWAVRPSCAKVDIRSLHAWAENGNVFNESKSHGVRQLVTAPELLSEIE